MTTSTPPIRIRGDLHEWLAAEADRMGCSIPALLNTLVERESSLGRMFLVRPMITAPGLSDASRELEELAHKSEIIVAYHDGRSPWGTMVAGKKSGWDRTTLDIDIHSSGRTIRIPRHFIFAWNIPTPGDFQQQILTAAYRYRELGVQLHPSVTLLNREAHGV